MEKVEIDYIEKLIFPHSGNYKQSIVSIARVNDKIVLGITDENESGTAFDLSELKQIYQMLDRHKELFLNDKIRVRLDRGKDINGEKLPEVNGEFDKDAQWMEVITHEIFHTKNLPVGAHVRLVFDPSFEGRVLED